jgi:hypothetical protein
MSKTKRIVSTAALKPGDPVRMPNGEHWEIVSISGQLICSVLLNGVREMFKWLFVKRCAACDKPAVRGAAHPLCAEHLDRWDRPLIVRTRLPY